MFDKVLNTPLTIFDRIFSGAPENLKQKLLFVLFPLRSLKKIHTKWVLFGNLIYYSSYH